MTKTFMLGNSRYLEWFSMILWSALQSKNVVCLRIVWNIESKLVIHGMYCEQGSLVYSDNFW